MKWKGISELRREFTNTYIALISDDEIFKKKIGVLIQSVPILFKNGESCFPFISGIEGSFNINGGDMYVGFAIKKHEL